MSDNRIRRPEGGREPEEPVATRLVREIGEAIEAGRLAPGERLVEADLARAFVAGRSSVREALGQLAAIGWIEALPNRGAAVRKLSRDEVRELFEIRERLEGLAAALAARRVAAGAASTGERRRLRALLERMERVADRGDAGAYGRLNRELHQAVLELAASRQLSRLAGDLAVPIFQRQFQGFLDPRTQQASHADHAKVVAAIEAGDAGAAERAMRRHVRRGLAVTLAAPAGRFATDADPP